MQVTTERSRTLRVEVTLADAEQYVRAKAYTLNKRYRVERVLITYVEDADGSSARVVLIGPRVVKNGLGQTERESISLYDLDLDPDLRDRQFADLLPVPAVRGAVEAERAAWQAS